MVYPVFSGPYQQRGYGAPHLWLRRLKPIAKKIGLTMLKHGAKLGKRVFQDVTSGKSFKESLKARSMQSLRDLTSANPTVSSINEKSIKQKKARHPTRRGYHRRQVNNTITSDIFDS